MVGRLETVVRPFETPDIFPPGRLAPGSGDEGPGDNILLKFGDEGQVKTLNGSFSSSQSIYIEQKHKEISREVTKKKITNPDDNSQFVEVELIKKLTTEKGLGPEYQKSTYELKNT